MDGINTKTEIFKGRSYFHQDDEEIRNKIFNALYTNSRYDEDIISLLSEGEWKRYWIKKNRNEYLIWDIINKEWKETDINGFRRHLSFILCQLLDAGVFGQMMTDEIKKKYYDMLKKFKNLKKIQYDFITDSPDIYKVFNKKKNVILFSDNIIYEMDTKKLRKNSYEDKITIKLPYNSSILELTEKDDYCKNYFFSLFNCEETGSVMNNIIYSAISGNRIRGFMPLWGVGRNGKSLFLNMISDIFGDWASSLHQKVLISKKLQSNFNDEMVAVCNKRIGYITEPPSDSELKEDYIKQITGNDKITIRDLNKSSYEDTPTASLFLACNTPPAISSDLAIQDRLFAFHFCNRFEKDENYEIEIKSNYEYFLSFILRTGEIYFKDPPRTENMNSANKYFELQSDVIEQYLLQTSDYEKDENEIFNQAEFRRDIMAWANYSRLNQKEKDKLKPSLLYASLDKKGYELQKRTSLMKNPRKGLRRTQHADNDDYLERFG